MQLDPALRVAIAIQANKGVYALLLGSGVSTAAGVPTGWQVLLDLIKKLTNAESAAPEDPEAWYRQRFNEEPN